MRDNVNGTSGRQDPFATVAAPFRGGGIAPVNVPVHFPHAGCFLSPCHGPNSHPTPMPSPTQFAWLPVGGGGGDGGGGGGTTPWTHAVVRSDTSTAAAILISLTFGMRNGGTDRRWRDFANTALSSSQDTDWTPGGLLLTWEEGRNSSSRVAGSLNATSGCGNGSKSEIPGRSSKPSHIGAVVGCIPDGQAFRRYVA